jgi:hypothetical protein
MADETISEIATRWAENRAWQEARETTIAAGERWVLGDDVPFALTASEREDLLARVRRSMETINGIPSVIADTIAAELGLTQQQAAALCVAAGERS